MGSFRHFLVKNFVLSYNFTLFGKLYAAPRASRIIYPSMVITGYIHATNESPLSWCLIGVVGIIIYFGFIHFKFFPVKWEELDDNQKRQYGFLKGNTLTDSQLTEWLELMKENNSK